MFAKNKNLLIAAAIALFLLWSFMGKKQGPKGDEPVEEPEPIVTESPTEDIEPPQPATTTATAKVAQSLPPPTSNLPQPLPDELQQARSAARVALSATYSAQKAFHAENGRYTTDLKTAGWLPWQAKMNFKMGFLTDFRPSQFIDYNEQREDPRRRTTDAFLDDQTFETSANFQYEDRAQRLNLSDYAQYCKTGCTAGESGFEILLAIPLGDTGRIDVWTMNEKKELIQVLDGTQ